MRKQTTKRHWTDEELLSFPDDGIKREIINGELVESGEQELELGRYWSDKELLALPQDGIKREIVEGRLVMSPAGYDHGFLINRLVNYLGQVVYKTEIGELGNSQTGFRLSNGDLFSPDISFVAAHKVAKMRASNKKSSFFLGTPDLAVEVLSPSDTFGVLEDKLTKLFAEGTQRMWLIYPRSRTVHVHRSVLDATVLSTSDTLDGENIIPGFKLKLSRLFG
jgi:Uma2 family endonuclease